MNGGGGLNALRNFRRHRAGFLLLLDDEARKFSIAQDTLQVKPDADFQIRDLALEHRRDHKVNQRDEC